MSTTKRTNGEEVARRKERNLELRLAIDATTEKMDMASSLLAESQRMRKLFADHISLLEEDSYLERDVIGILIDFLIQTQQVGKLRKFLEASEERDISKYRLLGSLYQRMGEFELSGTDIANYQDVGLDLEQLAGKAFSNR